MLVHADYFLTLHLFTLLRDGAILEMKIAFDCKYDYFIFRETDTGVSRYTRVQFTWIRIYESWKNNKC